MQLATAGDTKISRALDLSPEEHLIAAILKTYRHDCLKIVRLIKKHLKRYGGLGSRFVHLYEKEIAYAAQAFNDMMHPRGWFTLWCLLVNLKPDAVRSMILEEMREESEQAMNEFLGLIGKQLSRGR